MIRLNITYVDILGVFEDVDESDDVGVLANLEYLDLSLLQL